MPSRQDWRTFIDAYATAHPGEVVRIAEAVSLDFDVMALVLEYERRRRYPILFFEKIAGAPAK
jgi:3-polyprenyl-4-hydroxybenzoate decarboxylase